MKNFIVEWEIDIEADNHREAAEKAFKHMQEVGTTANCFRVREKNNPPSAQLIDLQEE